jgi:hypothetical protein
MSDLQSDHRPPRRSRGRLRSWTALGLCVVLAGVLAVVLLTRSGSSQTSSASNCLTKVALPEVVHVTPSQLGDMREEVARVLPERVGRLYEEGTVRASAAWSDEDPSPPATSPTASRPAGYEMRWWAPNGDDVVADVLVFASPSRARRFLVLASSTRCREHAVGAATTRPPLARNLSWLNPDGALQADMFMVRGARVYRVADAPAGGSPEEVRSSGGLRHAFATIDVLACLLPSAHCVPLQKGVPA